MALRFKVGSDKIIKEIASTLSNEKMQKAVGKSDLKMRYNPSDPNLARGYTEDITDTQGASSAVLPSAEPENEMDIQGYAQYMENSQLETLNKSSKENLGPILFDNEAMISEKRLLEDKM